MKTVLVVEDEYALLNVLALTLEAAGFAVRRAGDKDAALSLLRRGDVDLVLADSTLPGPGGLSLLEEMRRTPPLGGVPFVLMLAAHERLPETPVPLIKKPFSWSDLLAAVRTALGEDPR